MKENGRIIGWVPGIDLENKHRLPFRPEDKVLSFDVYPNGNHPKREGQTLDCTHFFSGRAGIEHMDTQYEGFNPDLMDTPGAKD